MNDFHWKRSYTYIVALLLIFVVAVFVFTAIRLHWFGLGEATEVERLFEDDAERDPFLNMAGEPIDLSESVDGSLVVMSWASWCPQCKDQLEMIDRVVGEYDAVSFVAINRAEPKTTAERYLASVTLSEDTEIILDSSDRFFKDVEGYAMPEVLFYDQEGNLLHHTRGLLTESGLRQQLESL